MTTAATPRRRYRITWLFLGAVVVSAYIAGAVFALGQFGGDLANALITPWTMLFAAWLCGCTLVLACARMWRGVVPVAAFAVWSLAMWLPPMLASPSGARDEAATSTSGHPLRVVEINMNCGTRPTPELLNWVQQQEADAVVAIECTELWQNALADALPTLTHRFARPDESPWGIAIFTRFPLEDAEALTGGDWDRPQLRATMVTPAGPVTLWAIHPPPPVGEHWVHARNSSLAWLAAQMDASKPTIVAGDINETPWGSAYRRFLRDSGLVSARDGHSMTGTWHCKLPTLVRIPIDHCFVSPTIHCTGFDVGPTNASDHLPCTVNMMLAPR